MKVATKCPFSLKKKRSSKCPISEKTAFKDQRSIANIRERLRTQNLNNAFESLKKLIPTMATDKLSKIQTLKIAKCYIQFLKGLLNEEPVEKYQHQNELKKGFKIWRMENEQSTGSQVSGEFLIKDELERDDFDKYSFDKDSFDRDLDDKDLYEKSSTSSKNIDDDTVKEETDRDAYFVKDRFADREIYAIKHAYNYEDVKDSFNVAHVYEKHDTLSNVIKQFNCNNLQFVDR